MALSNWDTLAIDQDGQPTNGVFKSESGTLVEFYKNWINIIDTDNSRTRLEHGFISYKGVDISAVRGPQDGIFAVISNRTYGKDYKDSKLFVMIGCGVYGYGKGEWVGVSKESKEFLKKYINSRKRDIVIIDGTKSQTYYYNQFEDDIRKISLDKALRFNQGDAYFAKHLQEAVPATEINKSNKPLITHLIKGLSK